MKTTLVPLLGLTAALCVAGCKTHVPMVRNHPPSYQSQTEAVAHWQGMVRDLCQSLASNTACAGIPIYIQPPRAPASEFETAYCKLLKTELLARAWRVVETPEQAPLRLSFDSQLVEHGARGFIDNHTTLWGSIGYSVAHLFSGNSDVTWCNYLSGDADATETGTRSELIVSAFIRQSGGPLLGVTQIVYVSAGDTHLYLANARDADWRQAEMDAMKW